MALHREANRRRQPVLRCAAVGKSCGTIRPDQIPPRGRDVADPHRENTRAPHHFAIRAALLANGVNTREEVDHDPAPIVKLFTPDAGATWLPTELDAEDPDIALRLCDLGLEYPKVALVLIREIK